MFCLVLGLMFLPAISCGCGGGASSAASACMVRVKRQASGLLLYAEDHDRFPVGGVWMDAIEPYIEHKPILREPLAREGGYGYAFNARLSKAKAPVHPERTPMVYDSTNAKRNASDPVTSLPRPGRHGGTNVVGYADGHVKRVPANGGESSKPQ